MQYEQTVRWRACCGGGECAPLQHERTVRVTVGLTLMATSVPVGLCRAKDTRPKLPPPRAERAVPFPAQSHCLLMVYRCIRAHSPHNPPWPGHLFPCQLSLTVCA